MSESTQNQQTNNPAAAPETGPEKTFTQAEVDSMIGKTDCKNELLSGGTEISFRRMLCGNQLPRRQKHSGHLRYRNKYIGNFIPRRKIHTARLGQMKNFLELHNRRLSGRAIDSVCRSFRYSREILRYAVQLRLNGPHGFPFTAKAEHLAAIGKRHTLHLFGTLQINFRSIVFS